MLTFYRRMIGFRNALTPLLKGTYTAHEDDEGYISFVRDHENARVFAAFNLSDQPRTVARPDGRWRLDKDAPFAVDDDNEEWTLPAWQALFAWADA